MSPAQIGPFTSVTEAAATAIGAGAVAGSFAMGVIGLLRGWSREEIGERALVDGYIGGIFGVAFVILDAALRYLV